MEYRVHMMDCTNVLLREIGYKDIKQKQLAITYALAIRSHAEKADEVDWRKVNEAIERRWSKSAVDRVKKMAWAYFKPAPKP